MDMESRTITFNDIRDATLDQFTLFFHTLGKHMSLEEMCSSYLEFLFGGIL